jgi:hypothetical protein
MLTVVTGSGESAPAFQKPLVPRLLPVAPLSRLPFPHPAPPVEGALRLALGRGGGAVAARGAREQSYGPGMAAGRRCWGACSRGGSAKRPFEFPSMLPLLSSPFAHLFSFLYSFP